MPKVRLTQPGFEHYTGQMGVVFFQDGLSTEDVSPNDARRMAAVMRCEWEGGGDPSSAQRLLDQQNAPAPSFVADGSGADHDAAAAKVAAVPVSRETQASSVSAWTQEALEALADAKGINGLREIATPMGIKGTTIAGLINAILKGPPQEH